MFFKSEKYLFNDIAENLCIHGRTEITENGISLAWAASGFTMKFKGRIAVFGFNEFFCEQPQIILVKVNGQITKYSVSNGKEKIIVDMQEQGLYELEFLRVSSSNVTFYAKDVAIYGEEVSIEKCEKTYSLKMEFLGDSITCGYGVLSVENEYFSYAEDATKTYAYLTAQHFNAEARLISYSGKGFYCACDSSLNDTFGEFFTRTAPACENNTWDFSLWKPDILVINGGTNDASGKASKEDFKKSAEKLYKFARSVYPDTIIIFILGAMGNGYDNELSEMCEEFSKEDRKLFYRPIKSIYEDWNSKVGSNCHPSYIGQKCISEELIAIIDEIR